MTLVGMLGAPQNRLPEDINMHLRTMEMGERLVRPNKDTDAAGRRCAAQSSLVFHCDLRPIIALSSLCNDLTISCGKFKNKTKEATVTKTVIESFNSTNDGAACEKCGEALIAPEWSEFVSERLILNLWACANCGNRFETEVCMPADAKADAEAIKDFFPSLLVA